MKRALSRKNLWEAMPLPAKRAASVVLGAVPLATLLGARFRQARSRARKADRWSADEARAYQVRQLRALCRLAYQRTRFYRRVFDEAGFDPDALREPEDLHVLPLIDKQTVLEHGEEMCAVPQTCAGVDYVATGGTSGTPLHFFIGADRSATEYAHLVTSWERCGYRLGVPLAVFRGRVVEDDGSGLRHEYDPLLRYHHYSNFHMTDENMERYLRHVATIGPCFLHVYPSSVAALARYVKRSGKAAPANVRGILAESENVYPDQRALAEEVFGCRYFSCYGHSEKLVLAAECEHSTDYHVWPSYGRTELVGEDGEAVTSPGQRGEIVGTGFINRVMPFIRYRTGDQATLMGERCEACGREQIVIRDIRGHRTQEMLVASDGAEISWTALNMHDDTFEGVRQFQFYQDTPGAAILKLVPGEGFRESDERRIRDHLSPKLSGRVNFRIERVAEIPLSVRGKIVYVDQRIGRSGETREEAVSHA
jgi:phenylacetate-CoA ligase